MLQIVKDQVAQRTTTKLQRTATFDGEPYEVGMLWNDNPSHLPNNPFSAMGQFKSLEKGFEKDLELNDRYEETIKTDQAKGFVRELAPVEIESTTKCPQRYLPHHPAAKPHKPEKVRRVCNAAAKYTGISLNDKLMPGPDLLNSLLGIIFRFRESFIAMTMDIEFMFLQKAVAKDECKFIKSLRQPNPTQTVDVYEYKRHVFGARISPTCVKYALRKAAEDSKNHYPKALEFERSNF